MDDGTGRSRAELALREGAALLAGALLGLLKAADAVLEAWPLPNSRPRRTAGSSDPKKPRGAG
jgi:hypothetical protein